MKDFNYQDLLKNNSAIFCKLDNLGIITVEGPDAKKFLQGQLTCDLESLTIDKHIMGGLYCNIQGRIISAFGIYRDHNSYYLLMPANIIPLTLTRLKKYAVFSKVTLSNATPSFSIIGLIGSQCETLISKIPNDITIIKIPSEPLRYLLITSPEKIKSIQDELSSQIKEAPQEIWRYCDIESGVANIHPETQEKFLPHELNYQNLGFISFNKGCYLGQEIIARMHYKGKLKYHLSKIILDTTQPLLLGNTVLDPQHSDQELGVLVNALPISNTQYITLIIQKISNNETC